MSHALQGKIAIVTGASRGVGKGIALALGEAGATVYITGRSVQEGESPLPGTIMQTAEEVTRLGGQGIAIRCDHGRDEEVEHLFLRVQEERGRLDILVNNAWSGRMDAVFCDRPFWEQPWAIWDELHTVGFRSHYIASALAARLMVSQRAGLIVNISSSGAARYVFNVAFGAAKAGLEKMTADMARELHPYGVAVISLWPGTVRTERVLAQPERWPLDIYRGESPQFAGRAVAALAADSNVMAKTGQRLIVSDLAMEYDFTDLDGTRPPLSPGIAALRAAGEPPSP